MFWLQCFFIPAPVCQSIVCAKNPAQSLDESFSGQILWGLVMQVLSELKVSPKAARSDVPGLLVFNRPQADSFVERPIIVLQSRVSFSCICLSAFVFLSVSGVTVSVGAAPKMAAPMSATWVAVPASRHRRNEVPRTA